MNSTLILVPGAFGTPGGFEKIIPHIGELQTYPGSYPSCDPPDALNANCSDDIKTLRSTLLSLLDQGKNLIVLAHSYGGVVAGGAIKDLDPLSRKARGYASAVVGLIYVAGNITLEGETLLEAIGGAYPPFIKSDKPSSGLALIEPAMDILYNDCEPSPELDQAMKPHALRAFETKPSAPGWKDSGFDGRRLYLRTIKDQCNPASLQDIWIEKTGVQWKVVDIDTGHMPFVSQPQAFGQQVTKFAMELAEL
ncbi:alpha/beta-hydrolase [Xylariaceae sp. FL0255]|nr:alpha/beta-hydrolase [Xylariaceae sp. FL0255]